MLKQTKQSIKEKIAEWLHVADPHELLIEITTELSDQSGVSLENLISKIPKAENKAREPIDRLLKLGYNLAEISYALNVRTETVSRWYNGHIHITPERVGQLELLIKERENEDR